jgi:hypothetical protein
VRSVWDKTFGALARAASGLGAKLSAPFNAVKGAVDSAISAVQRLISWLGKIKVPKISIPSPGKSAPSVAGASTRSGGTTKAAPAPITVIVNGAIDPEATARQIKRILSAHDRRTGGISGAGLRQGLAT